MYVQDLLQNNPVWEELGERGTEDRTLALSQQLLNLSDGYMGVSLYCSL